MSAFVNKNCSEVVQFCSNELTSNKSCNSIYFMKQRTIFIVHVVVIMKQRTIFIVHVLVIMKQRTIFIVHVVVIMKQGGLFLLSMW